MARLDLDHADGVVSAPLPVVLDTYLRGDLVAAIEAASIHAVRAGDHLRLGDDRAAERALKKFAATTKYALACFAEMQTAR